jgi:hypothetical protein
MAGDVIRIMLQEIENEPEFFKFLSRPVLIHLLHDGKVRE